MREGNFWHEVYHFWPGVEPKGVSEAENVTSHVRNFMSIPCEFGNLLLSLGIKVMMKMLCTARNWSFMWLSRAKITMVHIRHCVRV